MNPNILNPWALQVETALGVSLETLYQQSSAALKVLQVSQKSAVEPSVPLSSFVLKSLTQLFKVEKRTLNHRQDFNSLVSIWLGLKYKGPSCHGSLVLSSLLFAGKSLLPVRPTPHHTPHQHPPLHPPITHAPGVALTAPSQAQGKPTTHQAPHAHLTIADSA